MITEIAIASESTEPETPAGMTGPILAAPKPERPWQPRVFDSAQLQACVKVSSYNRHVNCRDCLLLDGIVPPIKHFYPYLDVMQKKVIDKAEQQFRKNHSISRSMFAQLLSTLKRVELPYEPEAEVQSFPQEKYQACRLALAEADELLAIMEQHAEKLRLEYSQGNLKWVEKLS